MSETPRIEVVLHREFSEPVEYPRYTGQAMFVTSCWITWQQTPDWAGYRFTVKVSGSRRKKDGTPYAERLDDIVWGKNALPWLERAGVTEATVADALAEAANQIGERSHS